MKKMIAAVLAFVMAMMLVACGSSHDISGVYLDSDAGAVYALAKDGTYRWYTFDYNTFVWGNYSVLDDEEVQIGTDVFSYVKDGNSLKLITDSYVYLDGTLMEKAPSSVNPASDFSAQSLVGAYSDVLNPNGDESEYVCYRYFYQDGTYEEIVNSIFNDNDVRCGTYEVNDGSLFLTNEYGDVSEYQVKMEGDMLFMYAKESGIINENEVWRKGESTAVSE